MNKPYISVITPNARPGGLDCLFHSLAAQTFKDFELIIVDSLYHYRKNIVKEKAKKYSINYKHIPSLTDRFPIQSYCRAMNTAITNVSGEVILFTSDYRYFMPDTLQKHMEFHKSVPDNFGYAPPSKFVFSPSGIKPGLPAYGSNENYGQYVKDLQDGKLKDYMWSIFDDKLFDNIPDFSKWQEVDRLKVGYDPKTIATTGVEVSPLHIYLQSESVKTKIVLEVNGINEELDGNPSYPDTEFSYRLKNIFNFKWIGDNTNTTYKIEGGHNIIDKMKLLDSSIESAKCIFEKYQNGSKDIPNNWSLSKLHKMNKIY